MAEAYRFKNDSTDFDDSRKVYIIFYQTIYLFLWWLIITKVYNNYYFTTTKTFHFAMIDGFQPHRCCFSFVFIIVGRKRRVVVRVHLAVLIE